MFKFIADLVSKTMQTIVDAVHSEPMDAVMAQLHRLLAWLGIPPPYIGAGELLVAISSIGATLVTYYLFFGRRHRLSRKALAQDLLIAQQVVTDLEQKLAELDKDEKPIRVWMDGAFDMMHFGHMNAFRQARALGTSLIVGINSDASIRACKGSSPVNTDEERTASVAGCKFVDEVVPDCPYVMNEEYLNEVVFGKYKCDLIVHGDDPCFDVHGNDVYHTAKELGKYRSIPRTEGVSTTDIVGRMLLNTKYHHQHADKSAPASRASGDTPMAAPVRLLATNRMLRLFSVGHKDPQPGARVVYMDGAWDMFHAAHIETLKTARSFGDYLLVGVQGDAIVNRRRGSNLPIMNLYERVLSVLGCKYVDDVLIDAPDELDEQMIKSLGITLVVHGTQWQDEYDRESYKVPKSLGIYREIPSVSQLTVNEIRGRILQNEKEYRVKFAKKKKAEETYYEKRYADIQVGTPAAIVEEEEAKKTR